MERKGPSARRAVAAIAAAFVIGVGGLAMPRHAAADSSYSGVASADGVRLTVYNATAPVTQTPVDGGGPTAQASLDSLGSSKAFASYPYPGDILISVPGLVAGLTGLPAPPGYPLYEASDYPTHPEGVANQGAYVLHAKSGTSSSTALAQSGSNAGDAGPNVVLAKSEASVVATASKVVAKAANAIDSFTVGALRLGQLTSAAAVTVGKNGKPTRTSSLGVATFSIAGTQVGITGKGLVLAGTTVPLSPGDAVFAPLATQGTSITYLAADVNKTGVVAPGLRVTTTQNLPSAGPTRITYTFGRAAANIDGAAITVELGTGTGGPDTEVGVPAGDTVAAPSGDAAAPTASATAGPIVAGGSSGLVPAPARATRSVTSGGAPLFDTASIYLFLVAGGLLAFGLTQLIRVLGVNLRWTS